MSNEEEANEAENPLTPEQRLDILEGKVGKNRILLTFVALILSVVISASVTAFVMSTFSGSSESGDDGESDEKLAGQAELLEQYDIRLAELSSQLKALDNRINNNANTTIQRILVEQEQAKQKFMDTVRSAIYDLAHMVPGSRSWLELYSDQLDEATAKSQQREAQLKALPTAEDVSEKDPFFSDDF